MKIRTLPAEELEAIYAPCFRRDFPASELMPLKRMLALTRRGDQRTLGLFDGEALAAYAVLISGPGPFVLLNYFAVEPDRRGQGVGTEFLRLLREREPGVLFEVEQPETAHTQEELVQRKRRIRFYLEAGAKGTGVDSWLFGVDYHIMYLGEALPEDGVVKEAMEGLYARAVEPKPGVGTDRLYRVVLREGGARAF